MDKAPALKRSLSLPVVALYGLGNILGAGIYVLVGKVAGEAGEGTIIAFLLAMVLAAFTAFSYMELSSRYPVSASASVYLHKAYRKKWLSLAVGLAMVGGGIASAAALSQGFAGYLQTFVDIPVIVGSVGLIIVLGLLAAKGVGESVKAAAILTCVEIFGLLLVLWVGRSAFGASDVSVGTILHIDPLLGISGVVAGTFLAFYAFIGFEDMVNVAEETKNAHKVMPAAILISLIASTALYLLVVFVALRIVPISELAASNAPLALVLEKVGSDGALLLAAIGTVATMNGVIVQIIMGSRVLYGLAKQSWLPSQLAVIHPRFKTPLLATAVVTGLMLLGTILLPLVSLAQLTSLLVLTIFALVNSALVRIKLRDKSEPHHTVVPLAVPVMGTLLCGAMIAYQIVDWL